MSDSATDLAKVDPRGCGGAACGPNGEVPGSGRSPRVRGSRFPFPDCRRLVGSIPAGAGEPGRPSSRRWGTRVDPCGCGGALPGCGRTAPCEGRSPRVRGSQRSAPDRLRCGGSIPAGAGEPADQLSVELADRVDPRGCGGAPLTSGHSSSSLGRSPRVRGSLRGVRLPRRRRGSIPAGAGEPATRSTSWRKCWVDPRGCGGAVRALCRRQPARGRSPRVRGSPAQRAVADQHVGSIPAGAGEPHLVSRHTVGVAVDPRGCGGALPSVSSPSQRQGRSPRVRGSRGDQRGHGVQVRSIPAGAGEPQIGEGIGLRHGVDPRGCGGAQACGCAGRRRTGRSPRVRGSPIAIPVLIPMPGSIPAGAGEPL